MAWNRVNDKLPITQNYFSKNSFCYVAVLNVYLQCDIYGILISDVFVTYFLF